MSTREAVNPKPQNPILRISWVVTRTVLLVLGLFWILVQIYFNVIPFDQAIDTFNDATNTEYSDFIDNASPFYNDTLETIYAASFDTFFIAAVVSALLGTLILGQRRTLSEAVALFVGFIIPRQRKFWGTISDQATGSPVPFAVIRLFKANSEQLVVQTVADLDGHYRLRIEDRSQPYRLQVEAPGYLPYRKDVNYKNQSLSKNELVEDIALSQFNTSPSLFQRIYYYLKPQLFSYLIYYLFILNICQFLISIYGILVYLQIDTVVSMVVYTFALIWNTIIIRERLIVRHGRVLEKTTKLPIAGAMVKLYQGEKGLESNVTDKDGVVKFSSEAGEYLAFVDKSGYEPLAAAKEMGSKVRVSSEGYLKDTIYLKKTNEAVAEIPEGNTLVNPFAGA